MTKETNNDGLTRNYGNPVPKQGVAKPTEGVRKELVINVDYDNLPSPEAGSAYSDEQVFVPAGAVVESSKLVVSEAFAGGTSVTLGFAGKDGSIIDADGIDGAITTANLTAGSVIVNDGALVEDDVVSTSVDAYFSSSTVGTFTAGKARLVITYLEV